MLSGCLFDLYRNPTRLAVATGSGAKAYTGLFPNSRYMLTKDSESEESESEEHEAEAEDTPKPSTPKPSTPKKRKRKKKVSNKDEKAEEVECPCL